MKYLFLFSAVLLCQFSIAQKSQDPQLIGVWSGHEKDNQRINLEKYWIMHRYEDGTFILMFNTIEDGEVDNFSEKGKWWVENGLFNEYHENSHGTDVYTYSMIDENHVRFKAKSLAFDFGNKDYEFIDTKIVADSL
jgi:hypothetical protein